MRVLLLKRQLIGGTSSYVEALAEELTRHEVEVQVEDASGWMPNETDIATSKVVTKRLKDIGARYDIVHAVGYRTAWACSDAYGSREAWVYTAYDMPKTLKKSFIDKLNDAQIGFCSSHAVRSELADSGATDVVVRYPGLRKRLGAELQPTTARNRIGVPQGVPVVAGFGRLVRDHAFESLILSMEQVWTEVPQAVLLIGGEGEDRAHLHTLREACSNPGQVIFLGSVDEVGALYQSCDLFVVPAWRAGFSMGAVEAMSFRTPVLARSIGGLSEIVQQDFSGLMFETDEELGSRITAALQMPMMLNSVGNAGRLRAETMFSVDTLAAAVARSYRNILDLQ